MKTAKALPFVPKADYISVILPGSRPFALDKTHPTFDRMHAAISKGKWALVPKLVSLAESIANESRGNVEVTKNGVSYKGKVIDNTLTQRIMSMIKERKPIAPMLKFMDNLYKNPSQDAVNEFYDWLKSADLPITDDGCFLAYKYLKSDFTDTHTGTVDNSPGQTILGSRKWFDSDYRTQCSSGYHVCSKEYGKYGVVATAVKINPKDVLSANGGKMRVVNYEVLFELGRKEETDFKLEGYAQLEKKLLVEVASTRKELLANLLALPPVKRAIRRGKIQRSTISKQTYGRLEKMFKKFMAMVPVAPEQSTMAQNNNLKAAREAAGLTLGQVAKQLGLNYKATWAVEKSENPRQDTVDRYVEAIANLSVAKAVTFPKPTESKHAPHVWTSQEGTVDVYSREADGVFDPATNYVPYAHDVEVEGEDDGDDGYGGY